MNEQLTSKLKVWFDRYAEHYGQGYLVYSDDIEKLSALIDEELKAEAAKREFTIRHILTHE